MFVCVCVREREPLHILMLAVILTQWCAFLQMYTFYSFTLCVFCACNLLFKAVGLNVSGLPNML